MIPKSGSFQTPEYRKRKIKTGDRVWFSLNSVPFRNVYKLLFTQAFASKKLPTYSENDEQDDINHDEFHPENFIKVI